MKSADPAFSELARTMHCRRPMRALVGFFFVASLFVASVARADPLTPAEPALPLSRAPRDSPVQLHLDAAAGLSTTGGLVSALGLVRFGLVELGGSYTSSGLFSSRTGGGLSAGAGSHPPGGTGWDMLVELGINEHHVSGGLLTGDPGATGSIPYGGFRAGVDWSIGNPANVAHVTLGLWLLARADLASREVSYVYADRGLFSGNTGPFPQTNGSVRLGGGGEIGIAFAGGFDFLP